MQAWCQLHFLEQYKVMNSFMLTSHMAKNIGAKAGASHTSKLQITNMQCNGNLKNLSKCMTIIYEKGVLRPSWQTEILDTVSC